MNKAGLAQPGTFCWNSECADYAKVNLGNIRKYGQTAKGVQRPDPANFTTQGEYERRIRIPLFLFLAARRPSKDSNT